MLHRHPFLGRTLSLIILALYLAGMYFGWQFFLASPQSASLLKPFTGMASTTGPFGNRTDFSQRLYSTADGGQTWQPTFTDKTNYLAGINCSSPLDCLVIGNNFDSSGPVSYADSMVSLVTDNAGQKWDTVHPKLNPVTGEDEEGSFNPGILSCPAPSNCLLLVATDTTGLASTTDGGRNWQIVNKDISSEALNALSCVSASVCNVVGQDGLILHSDDGGRSWAVQKSNTDATLLNLSCNSTGFCLSVGRAGLTVASEDGGKSWTKKSTAPLKTSFKLVCGVESACYAAGYIDNSYKLEVTRNRGVSWEVLGNAPKKGVIDLSCPADDTCFVLTSQTDTGISFSGDGGTSWTSLRVAEKIRVDAISCVDKLKCFVIATPTK